MDFGIPTVNEVLLNKNIIPIRKSKWSALKKKLNRLNPFIYIFCRQEKYKCMKYMNIKIGKIHTNKCVEIYLDIIIANLD